ncbi:hypothetical protein LIER_29287 [Lithospermum erythrorhizon]|uniref:Protein FAR1-RELATED SEQUENCE n=1 Tax=Lithospermum erythrorhizon TaxID=34254 RepID=A0AAV3RLP3_LITER
MSEEETDITHNYGDALISLTEENEDSSKETFEPFVGKCFLSEEEAYEWHVTKYADLHNHNLLPSEEEHFLPSYCVIEKEDEKLILLLKEASLSIRQILRVLELEKKVKHGYLPFLSKDLYNYFDCLFRENDKNDAMDFVQYCFQAKVNDPNFQYSLKLDADNKLENIFWCPAHCFDWYQKFGDVVVFDTTYKINAYDMPFGIFIGMDNYGKTILFGCALLRDVSSGGPNDFVLINRKNGLDVTYVKMMKHPPKTILTDQDPWMTEAIAREMPSTKHAFCIWHITSKFSGRSESINAFIKRFVSSHSTLVQLMKQVHLAMEDIEETQFHNTMLVTFRGSSLRTLSPLEQEAHNISTPYAFKIFQE